MKIQIIMHKFIIYIYKICRATEVIIIIIYLPLTNNRTIMLFCGAVLVQSSF